MGPCTTETCLKLSVWMYIIILRSCPIIIAVVLFCLCHRTLAPYQHRMQPYYASSPPHMVPAIARMPVHPKLNRNQGKWIYVADPEFTIFNLNRSSLLKLYLANTTSSMMWACGKPIMTTMFERWGQWPWVYHKKAQKSWIPTTSSVRKLDNLCLQVQTSKGVFGWRSDQLVFGDFLN